jgi:hypothetical protein
LEQDHVSLAVLGEQEDRSRVEWILAPAAATSDSRMPSASRRVGA